jgi:Heparinase II/III-like protein/Domain of unknown function (DUF4962)
MNINKQKQIRHKRYSIIIVLCLGILSICNAQHVAIDNSISKQPHPRLLLLQGEEEAIQRKLLNNASLSKISNEIIAECNEILKINPLVRIQVGKRLLDKSREALRRIYFLSYAFRITKDKKFAVRAEEELLAVSQFTDWNPSHFLDVAEMTMAASIGYDWLYNFLSPTSKLIIANAILTKGLKPSFEAKYNNWLYANNNWNQVCNAGMCFGAIVLYNEQPEISETIINRAIQSIKKPMAEYSPDGGYPEGYGYWGYGTNFNVMFLAAIEKLFHHFFGLSEITGFLQTPYFFQNMTGPSGRGFNFSDSDDKPGVEPAMFWFSQMLGKTSLLFNSNCDISQLKPNNYIKNRLLPSIILWAANKKAADIAVPKNLIWVSNGKTPVAIMRSSWTDAAAIFLAAKGGTPSTNHAHMDVGSFIMEADGERWAMDFGADNYEAIEAKGIDLWNNKQNSQRWQIFRYNNQAHNTITINDSLQLVNGFAPIISFSKKEKFMNAVFDLKTLYNNKVANAKRGVAIVNKSYVTITDEIEANETDSSKIHWNMLTGATIKILSNKEALLTKNGRQLFLLVQSPANIILTTRSTEPGKGYEAKNTGTQFIGFDVAIAPKTNTTITVLLIPEKFAGNTKKKVAPLKNWK